MSAAPIAPEFTPIVKRVEVRCGPDRAFDLFTRRIAEWWPLTSHSVYGDESADVVLEPGVGGEIVETSRSGATQTWGTVTAWEPGRRLAFSWHPGIPLDESTDVEVRFIPRGAGTLVELEHAGWERRRESAERRASYEVGWTPVLDRFVERSNAAEPDPIDESARHG
jgi:uncharacterized protein YndB with AHSA1/START domain